MSRQVYKVTVEFDAYVVAESAREAEEWATYASAYDLSDEPRSASASIPKTVDSEDAESLPHYLPRAIREGLTVGEWLARTKSESDEAKAR